MTLTEARVQRVMIWCGPAMVVLWVGAFIGLAGFIPPHDPTATATEIANIYTRHLDAIRLGLVISMCGSALLVPWAVAISGQLRQIDGARGLATVQMVSCALLSVEFITPIAIWMAATFRAGEIPAATTRTINDVGWIVFMTVIWSLWVQLIALGTGILLDRRERPIFPRWTGYLSFWVSLLIMPAGIVLFFKHGAFAWNGVIGFFTPLTGFAIWIASITIVVHRNLTNRIADGSEPTELRSNDERDEQLAAEIASLREELARVAQRV